MFNFGQNYSKKPICTKWKEKHEFINYNFFDSKTYKLRKIMTPDFKDYLKDICKNKKVVITGGHFIPDPGDYDNVPKNPIATWGLTCETVKELKAHGIEARVSLILNDAFLTSEAREIIFTKYLGRLPNVYRVIMENKGLLPKDILPCSFNNDLVFSEKKLSNRTTYLVRRKKALDRQFKVKNHCISGLISYFIDLDEGHNIDVSVTIFPLCSWVTIKKAIDLYLRLNNKLRHICYFYTPNCLY